MHDSRRQLEERIKELRCLYRIARAFARRDARLDELVVETVQLIPPAWQYPEIAAARIVLAGVEATSPGWRETPWSQECPVILYGEPRGSVQVNYTVLRSPADEGPFLAEERNLLNTIAQLLGEVAERKLAEERLARNQRRLRSLAAELALGEQRERRRIAEALHDRIGQSLALAKLHLGAALAHAEGGPQAAALGKVRDLVSQVIAETRSLTFELYPPILHELGLEAALAWLGEQIEEQYGLRVEVVDRGDGAEHRLPDEVRVTLFTAARELLINVTRHARAQRARVEVAVDPQRAWMTVEDDGDGFDVALVRARSGQPGGFGLFSIEERIGQMGGRVEIRSAVGSGTWIRVELPAGDGATPG